MNDVKQLFQDIKNVFKTEGVDVETEEILQKYKV